MQAKSPRRPWLAPLAALVISAGAVIPLVMQQHTIRANAKSPAVQRVINDITPLCRLLLPDEDTFTITAAPPNSPGGNASEQKVWTVDCINTHGDLGLHIQWQAERKQAVWINRFTPQDALAARRTDKVNALSQTQAVDAAREWVGRLGMAPRTDALHCAFTAHRTITTWWVHLSLPVGKTSVCMDMYTGQIQVAYVRDGPPMSTPSAQA